MTHILALKFLNPIHWFASYDVIKILRIFDSLTVFHNLHKNGYSWDNSYKTVFVLLIKTYKMVFEFLKSAQ